MREIPKAFKNSLNQTLLGRLRLKLFKEITQADNFMPDTHEVIQYILQKHQKNSDLGKFLGLFINHTSTRFADFSELVMPMDIVALLSSLEDQPIEKPIFIEFKKLPENYPQSLGAFIYTEYLDPEGYIYVISIIEEEHFPTSFAGHAEIRASRKFPEPAFSVFETEMWQTYNWNDVQGNKLSSLFIRILNYIDKNRTKNFVTLEEVRKEGKKFKSILEPPDDKIFQLLLSMVLQRRIICTKALVDISLVKPFSYDFAFSYPKDKLDEAIKLIEYGKTLELLVYWSKDHFIMSDDYPFYLAYRKLKVEKVPIVIMGPYPKDLVKPIQVGGVELIPPLFINHSVPDATSTDILDYELDKHLEDNRLSEIGWSPS